MCERERESVSVLQKEKCEENVPLPVKINA